MSDLASPMRSALLPAIALLTLMSLPDLSGQAITFGLRAESLPTSVSGQGLQVTDMALDDMGRVWMSTASQGIYRHDGQQMTRMDWADQTVPRYDACIEVFPNGDVWIGSDQGLITREGSVFLNDSSWTFGPCIDIVNSGMGEVFALSPEGVYRRQILGTTWQEEPIEGMNQAYQLTMAHGALMLSSAEGLWMRNVAGQWMALRDGMVSASMPLGESWLAITDNGLEQLVDGGWRLLQPAIKGYHRGIPTANGDRLWLYGESGLWHIREDGEGVRMHGIGGATIESVQAAITTGAGGLFMAVGNEGDMLRIHDVSTWYDLRSQYVHIGHIQHMLPLRSDSVWLVTNQGLFSAGLQRLSALPSPGPGVIKQLIKGQGEPVVAVGEFGQSQWLKGQWQTAKGKALDGQALDLGALLSYDRLGWYSQTSKRRIANSLKPAVVLFEQSVLKPSFGQDLWLRIGLKGLNQPDMLSMSYVMDGGDTVQMGRGRRLNLIGLSAGPHDIHVMASGAKDLHHQIMVLPPWWMDLWVMGPTALLLLMVGSYILWISMQRRREKRHWGKEKMQLERMALRLQMNPHFTFNALESISAFVLKNQPKVAITYLNKFAKLMRYTLESADHGWVDLTRESTSLSHYIALEQMRFSDGFQSVVEMDEGLMEDARIPPMMLQPLVENAILHGLRPKMQAGNADCYVKLTYRIDPADQHVMIVTVEDNGIGRQAAMKLASGDEGEKRSAATDILALRLAALSQETGKPHTVSTVDLDEGTMVTLVLPLHREWD